MIQGLLQRLAEQRAAIGDAEAALRRLVEVGVGLPGPAEAGERVVGPLAAPQSAICAAPDCSTPLPVQTTGGQRRKYCCDTCRDRATQHRIRARRAEQAAAEDRAQAAAIVAQNTREGYTNLTWSNGHATAAEARDV